MARPSSYERIGSIRSQSTRDLLRPRGKCSGFPDTLLRSSKSLRNQRSSARLPRRPIDRSDAVSSPGRAADVDSTQRKATSEASRWQFASNDGQIQFQPNCYSDGAAPHTHQRKRKEKKDPDLTERPDYPTQSNRGPEGTVRPIRSERFFSPVPPAEDLRFTHRQRPRRSQFQNLRNHRVGALHSTAGISGVHLHNVHPFSLRMTEDPTRREYSPATFLPCGLWPYVSAPTLLRARPLPHAPTSRSTRD
jgi:hypothetical protein